MSFLHTVLIVVLNTRRRKMPSPKEKLALYWPIVLQHDTMMLECPFCAALVPSGSKHIHIEYHIKLLDRLDRLEGIEAILAKEK